MTVASDLAALVPAVELLEQGLTLSNEQRQEQAVLIAQLEDDKRVLLARVRELEGQTPPVDPPPPPVRRTVLGACPMKGAPLSGVVSKWGQGAALRVFQGGAFQGLALPAGVGPVHLSFKPPAALSDAQVISVGRYLRPGDYATVWHESDVKHKSGRISDAQVATYIGIQNDFAERVDRLRNKGDIPNISTVCVLGGWRFRGGTDGDRPDKYLADADCLGVDLDGANNAKSYYDWTICLPEVARAAARYGGRWLVPEYAWGRRSDDASGEIRAAEIRRQMPLILAAKPEVVCWFDYENVPGEPLTTPAEVAAFKAFF